MPFYLFHWTPEIEEHLAEHGVTPEQFEAVVMSPNKLEPSRSSDRTVAFGYVDGVSLTCVYEDLGDYILPVTAFEEDY